MLLQQAIYGTFFAGFGNFSTPPGGSCSGIISCVGLAGANLGWIANLLFITLPSGLIAMTTLAGTATPEPIRILYTITIVLGLWIPFLFLLTDFFAGVLP